MKRVILLITTFAALTFFCPRIGAGITLKGRIRHANTYTEINKVNVFIKGTSVGTSSQSDGSFLLDIPAPQSGMIVVFKHISFFDLEIPLATAQQQNTFYLRPRVIPLPEITVEGEKDSPQIIKDIPQPHSIIKAKNFQVRGFIDAGDLLRTQQSIQVDEELSGSKLVTIRGGNADDVTVLYDGITLNNLYDNTFDFSLLNLEDIDQIEIIRGSNSVLYGPGAISGIVNLVPKREKNYLFRFQQKLGTYASGAWNLQLHKKLKNRFDLSYSIKQEGLRREYSGASSDFDYLENKKTFHTANLLYSFARKEDVQDDVTLSYIRSDLDYRNNRYREELTDFNQLLSLRYQRGHTFNAMVSYHWLDNENNLTTRESVIERYLDNRIFFAHIEKSFTLRNLELLSAYQFENGLMDYHNSRTIPREESTGIEKTSFSRQKHGIVAILKLHVPTSSAFYRSTDFDLTYRNDTVMNDFDDIFRRQEDPRDTNVDITTNPGEDWHKSTIKFSSHLAGQSRLVALNGYLNFGKNVKFPTMFQQMSAPTTLDPERVALTPLELSPENNSNAEIGIDVIREIENREGLDGVQINVNYFKNLYTNKIVTYYSPRSPVAFYDNIHTAEISGLEIKGSLFFFDKKLTLDLGSSLYSIPEKTAFPFKSDKKHIANLLVEHAGYSMNLCWFYESDQIAWVRGAEGSFWEIGLPGYSNVDIHMSKQFEWRKLKFFINFSGRNVLDDDTELEGIAIRDRRLYLTFGMQY